MRLARLNIDDHDHSLPPTCGGVESVRHFLPPAPTRRYTRTQGRDARARGAVPTFQDFNLLVVIYNMYICK